jgi:uncharacterized protein (TIGR03435 family)
VAQRFSLAVHRETTELSAYALNLAGSGPKLTVNESGRQPARFAGRGPGSIGVFNSSMEQFAGYLQAYIVHRPVVDKTGLTAKYDFTLN